MTVRAAGQYYQVPLVGKYGRNEGAPASDRFFCVSLIPSSSAKSTKTFRIRGVADVYEQFDRPDNKDPEIAERPRLRPCVIILPIDGRWREGCLYAGGGRLTLRTFTRS